MNSSLLRRVTQDEHDSFELNYENSEEIGRNVTVTFHGYKQFKFVHQSAHLSFETIYQSLHPRFNREMIFKAGESSGRSGSFFFFSHDDRFIVKTMSTGELDLFLNKLLPAYCNHILEPSLMAKILGVFTVESAQIKKIHLMLMENTLRIDRCFLSEIPLVFDLKGSTVDRKAGAD